MHSGLRVIHRIVELFTLTTCGQDNNLWISFGLCTGQRITCGQCEQYCINCQDVDLYSVVGKGKDYKNGKDIKIRVFEGAGDC
jgi:hypothetical protein